MQKNEMRATLPGISVQRKDGTIAHYRNSEYIPFLYMIPKEVVEYFGKSFLDIPREPYALFNYKDIKEKIESDLFLDFISNVTEFMVWTFMDRGKSSYVYSGYEPAWIVAYSLPIWVKGFIDYDGMWDARELKSQVDSFLHFHYPYIPMEESQKRLSHIVPQVMKQYNIDKVIEVIKEYRCFEDFVDNWKSNQKTDFFRKWYHNRTKHPTVSLDAEIEQYAKYNDGRELDFEDVSANAVLVRKIDKL